MNISILTLFPELYGPFLETSLLKKAQERSVVNFDLTSFFSFVAAKERIDAPTFGHGAGMLIKPEVIQKTIAQQEERHGSAFKIFFSPQAKKLDQVLLRSLVKKLATSDHIMLVASRYEGIDARVEEVYADLVVSVGDFVVLGGDIPAMLFLEGFVRLLPGVVGKVESIEQESFSGAFIDHPEYTVPAVWQGLTVPEVIRSGNHKAITLWRKNEAAKRTVFKHFNWLRFHCTEADQELAQQFIPPHYVILMHSQIVLPHSIVGNTSITSFDIHDVARSCRTFGIKNYFIATPLIDQQKIVRTLLNFWESGVGIDYNKKRHEAISIVKLVNGLQEAIDAITEQHGIKPLLLGTSARCVEGVPFVGYDDQAAVWDKQQPILFVFGTGKGLAQEVLEQCDFMLGPVKGFSDFNHLSVRAAVSIILDRWMGITVKDFPCRK